MAICLLGDSCGSFVGHKLSHSGGRPRSSAAVRGLRALHVGVHPLPDIGVEPSLKALWVVPSKPATLSRTPGCCEQIQKCRGTGSVVLLGKGCVILWPKQRSVCPAPLRWDWDTSIKSACSSSPRRWAGLSIFSA